LNTFIKINYFLASIFLISCVSPKSLYPSKVNDFTIAFGSCNKQKKENILWKEIQKNKPNLWVWGGDNIYANTDNIDTLRSGYRTLKEQKGYVDLVQNISVMATWDDHDYGMNDGGVEFSKKEMSQEVFLDFFNVDTKSHRRNQNGVYHSEIFKTPLTKSKINKKRFVPNTFGEGSLLGAAQWNWLTDELHNSNADFNIIVSSIQVLSAEHGFETWGNFPHEVEKLKNTIVKSSAKGVLLLSGDRHISEFSKTSIANLSFPLIDFTSSGLTHSYQSFSSEKNKYRVQNVVSEISFGVLKFNFDAHTITMQMRGKDNKLLQELFQAY
jgi:alkaline phosphatase D